MLGWIGVGFEILLAILSLRTFTFLFARPASDGKRQRAETQL
jgi:hypothetical protein